MKPVELPFKLVRGFGVVVRGGIGPLGNLNFLLDTGSVPSVLSVDVASRISVEEIPGGQIALPQQRIEGRNVIAHDVRLGPADASSLRMVVLDLSTFGKRLGIRIDAIVGLDLLNGRNFSIDYRAAKLVFVPQRHASHVVTAEIRALNDVPYWILTLSFRGRDFRMLFDTGANDLLLFAGDIPDSMVDSGTIGPQLIAVEGEARVQYLQAQRITLGDAHFERRMLLTMKKPPEIFPSVEGLLGPTALEIRTVEFDWEHKCLRWD